MHFALGHLKWIQRTCIISVLSRSSHYDVLGVSRAATHEQIKNRYYELSKKYHPDLNDSEEGADKFRELAEAYEVLGSVDERRTYDKMQNRPGKGNRAGTVTVSEDYSQHLRDRFKYTQRSSKTGYQPKYRKAAAGRSSSRTSSTRNGTGFYEQRAKHYTQQHISARMSVQTSEPNIVLVLVVALFMLTFCVINKR